MARLSWIDCVTCKTKTTLSNNALCNYCWNDLQIHGFYYFMYNINVCIEEGINVDELLSTDDQLWG
jgi:hypothetical protein